MYDSVSGFVCVAGCVCVWVCVCLCVCIHIEAIKVSLASGVTSRHEQRNWCWLFLLVASLSLFFPACFQFPRNRKTIAQAIYAFSISHCVFGFSWQTNKQTNRQRRQRRRRQQLPSFPARGNGRIFSTMPASNRQLPASLFPSLLRPSAIRRVPAGAGQGQCLINAKPR